MCVYYWSGFVDTFLFDSGSMGTMYFNNQPEVCMFSVCVRFDFFVAIKRHVCVMPG